MNRRMLIAYSVMFAALALTFTLDFLAQSQEPADKQFPSFRPCKVEYDNADPPKLVLDETPFDAPAFPKTVAIEKAMKGNTYQWHVNDKTGEFLYRRVKNNLKIEFTK